MFKINDKTLFNEEVELYEVNTLINGEHIEDTYNIFIGAKDDKDTFVLNLYTIEPRKTFYKFDFQHKVMINDYLDDHDVSVTYNGYHSTEDVKNGFFCLTRIGKTLFKLDLVLPKFETRNKVEYLEVHTHIDFIKDVYQDTNKKKIKNS